ncbi:hypothetical protein [Nonomuraea sp. NPDC049400]|uniref:hypothetical protein n=1 Tax=Nonomuraea sp. NPDC049400 TaxID=3364352 RepID=UPI0037AD9741
MRIKKSLMLAGSGLLTAIALGSGAASPAVAAQTLTESVANSHVAGQPPDDEQKQYDRGRREGFADGRAECEGEQPSDRMHMRMHDRMRMHERMRMRMGMPMKPYERGFMKGYHSGYHSCTPA